MRGRAERKGPAALGPMIDRVRNLPSTPLPESTRREVEAATATDLSGVRVHRTPEAARYAEALGARAFTFDRDIVVGGDAGETTIAHEAAHAAQFARHGSPSAPVGVAGHGHAAHAEAKAVAGGGDGTAGASPGGLVQRDEAPAEPRPRRLTADEARRVGNGLLEHLGLLGEYDASQLVAFLDANDALMSALLGRYGYRGCYVDFPTTLNAFHKAYEKWFAAEGFHAQFEHPGQQFNDPLYAKIREREQNQLVWGALPDGTGYMGTRRDLKAAVDDWHVRRTLQTGENIAGGLFGAIGYGLAGDEGSDLGSSFDGVMMAAGSTAEARNQMRDVGAGLRRPQEQAEVRRAEPSASRSEAPATANTPAPTRPAPVATAPAAPPVPAARSEVDPIPVLPSSKGKTPAPEPAKPPPPGPTQKETPAATAKTPTSPKPKAATSSSSKPPQAPKPPKAAKAPSQPKTPPAPKTPGASKPSKANAPGAPNLAPYPGWKAEWDRLAEKAMEPTPRASDDGFAFRTATSEDRKIRVVVTEGRITKAFIEDPERGPALPGEQSAHSIARNLGEETGPSTQASAPRASNLSQDKTAENFLRHAADVAAESGARIEVRTTLVTEPRMVNGEEVPVQIAKRRQAFLVMPGSIESKEIYRYETQVDPVTRAVSEKTPPPRHIKSKVDRSQWLP